VESETPKNVYETQKKKRSETEKNKDHSHSVPMSDLSLKKIDRDTSVS
jgi:hypothetical protein